jgi:hypothetical protein
MILVTLLLLVTLKTRFRVNVFYSVFKEPEADPCGTAMTRGAASTISA